MNDIQMRGYVLLSGAEYLRSLVGDERASQMLDAASPGLKQELQRASAANWCSAEHISELYRTIASVADGDETKAQEELIACGKAHAKEASNTFLRLLMKMLTPNLFAKKLPDLWDRDCKGSKLAVEVESNKIRNRLSQVEGFDHIAPVSAGYAVFALETMGKTVLKTELHGWSLNEPANAEPWFEVHWQV